MAAFLASGAGVLPLCGAAPSAWVVPDSGTTFSLWGIAVGTWIDGGSSRQQIVAVGESGTIITSTDGVTWTRRQSGTDAWLTAASFLNVSSTRRFFAVGDGGTILSSPDGITWTREASPTSVRLNVIAAGPVGGVLYAFGEPGAGWLVCDFNGVWTRQEAPFSSRWIRGVVHGTVIGQAGTIFAYEPVDYSWTAPPMWRAVTAPTDSDLEALAWGPPPVLTGSPQGSLVAVGADGTIIQQAADGEWVRRESGTRERLRGITTRSGGSVTLVTNTLRISLSEFFAVGTNGTILRSADGVTWMADDAPVRRNLNAIASSSDAVLAVGDTGTILMLDRSVGPPVIVKQPAVVYDAAGRPHLEAEVAGNGALSYLWVQLTAGAPWFVGSGGPRQAVPVRPPVPSAAISPVYQLVVGNAFGITRSDPIVPHRLANLSMLAVAGTDERALIGGFSFAPGTPSLANGSVLIRAVGPGLWPFGVDNLLNAPRIALFAGDRPVATNVGWRTAENADQIRAAAQRTGAFPLGEDSADAALLVDLPPGNYTAVIESATGTAGAVLLEIYDAGGPTSPKLANLSGRADVRPGEHITVGGVVVTGGLIKPVLLRAAGPALRGFGIGRPLMRPQLVVRRGAQVLANGGAWGNAADPNGIRMAANAVNAFPFPDGSADAAMLFEMGPDAYTIEVGSADGGSGIALFEIWEQRQR